MSKQQILKTDIDDFINALEEMIDARDDMWEEEKHHNYRGEMKIREERYEPARTKLYTFLEKLSKISVD
jgi:hypothetical protein